MQVRQHVDHKKTLLNLEQNLLKQKFSDKVMKVETNDDGIDFFFKHEQDAHKYVEFIKSHIPVALKHSKQLISQNERDNTANVKTTFSLTIPKICKDDLIRLHPVNAKELGSGTILLCTKLSSNLYFIDVANHKKVTMTIERYFHYEPYMDIYRLKHFGKEFIVLDNEGKRND